VDAKELLAGVSGSSPAPPSVPAPNAAPPKELPFGVWDDPDPELTAAVVADFVAGWQMDMRGELDQYDKHHVAILNGKVVGFDKDSGKLRDRLEREQKIPLYRQVVIFVGDDTI
jgi:hypothetical protein